MLTLAIDGLPATDGATLNVAPDDMKQAFSNPAIMARPSIRPPVFRFCAVRHTCNNSTANCEILLPLGRFKSSRREITLDHLV